MANQNVPTTNQFIPEPIVFNNTGERPTRCGFSVEIGTFAKHLEECCRREISDVRDLTYKPISKTGKVYWVLWFDSESDHFWDKSTNSTGLNAPISRYSKEFLDFANKFGWRPMDDDPKNGGDKVKMADIIRTNENRREMHQKMTGIVLAINPFIYIMYDASGEGFQKKYGQSAPKQRVSRKWIWREGPKGKYDTLVGIEIDKYYKSALKSDKHPEVKLSGVFM